MPATLSYPGVYVEEISSGVRAITGVATSITAFIGRAARGPVNEAVTINSFGDFERTFGGLWADSTMSYALRDFFQNGGGRAVIVRLFAADAGDGQAKLKLKLDGGGELEILARNPGSWGNSLRARVDDVKDPEEKNLFNLSIHDGITHQTEVFRNVSLDPKQARRLDKVLLNESKLVRINDLPPTGMKRPIKYDDPTSEVWKNDKTSTGVADADIGNDGNYLDKDQFTGDGKEANKEGLYALEQVDIFNLLCIPPFNNDATIMAAVVEIAASYCEKRRAMLLVDPPTSWNKKDDAVKGIDSIGTVNSKNAAIFFPQLRQPNPLRGNQTEDFAPCGAVAGVFARTDATRGIWKAPAGFDATLVGVPELGVSLTDAENGELNLLGINCLRTLPAAGRVVWGSRTLQGDDRLSSEWKYIPVRRTALYIEESLYRGTQWVVFEPNDESLWAQIRLNIGAFMQTLFRQGAFQGRSPQEAYFVKCDKETTTSSDVNLGIVNIVVGFAPLKPAEFIIIKLQQMAGQT